MAFVLVCLGLWLSLAPSAAVAQAGPRAEAAALLKAERLVQRGKSERAARGLAQALAKAPSDTLLVRYAELALALDLPESERAEQALRHAADVFVAALAQRKSPADALPEALVLSAVWAHALRGDFARSQALAERQARADDPRTTLCLRAVAALALLANEVAVARAVLTLARSLAPTDPNLESELGLVALAEGDTSAALPPLAERFARDPSLLLARRDLAYALSADGRPEEGFALLGVAAGACAQQPTCLLERGRWALEAGLLGEALAATRALLSREPEHLDALFLSADALLAQGELDQARLIYQTILRIAPDNLRAKDALSGLAGNP